MTTIYARAQDQVLVATILPKLACNNRKSVKLHVDFDSVWDDYAKSALFYTSNDPTVYPEALSSSGECTIPHEVLADAGYLFITIQGVNSSNGRLKSTTPIQYKILPGTPSLVVSPPSPGVYQQLLTEAAKINVLASLKEGSTTGDAELQLIRVGADGITYESASVAVREQIKKTFNAMATDLTFKQGSIASANGTNTDNVTNRIRTGFVLAKDFISASVGSGFILAMFQYDANLGFISSTQWSSSGGIFDNSKLEDNCNFIRFAVARSDATDIAIDTDTGFTFISRNDLLEYENKILRDLIASDVEFENGTLNAHDGAESNSDTRIRTGFLSPKFEKVEIDSGLYLNMFQYDASYAFLETTDFVREISPSIIRDDCAYIRFVIRYIGQSTISPDDETGFAIYRSDVSLDKLAKKTDEAKLDFHKCKFNGEIINTAYSTIGLAPINTREHFQLASHLGFNSIKGDVRITSDNKLIMCHDAGITLDSDGRITSFDSSNCTAILNSTYEYLMSLEYAASFNTMGHYAKVCDFETFIRICKENGKIAYITLRENKIPELVAAMMEILKKYHMENHCIINSYTLATLREVRKHNEVIPLSQVIQLGNVLTKAAIDNVIPLKNAIVTMFLYPTDNPLDLWEQSTEALNYALENGVQIHMAQVNSHVDYSAMIQRGVQGFHITKPFLEYKRSDIQFVIILKSGVATFGNVFGGDRLDANVSNNNGDVTIRNISVNGSGYDYDDGLPELWLNMLPFNANAKCANNAYCGIRYQDGGLVLNTSNVDGTYYINVNI